MGFRFFRRMKIAPGLTLNLSKSGPSLSFGPRGAKVTVGRRGVRRTGKITLPLPGEVPAGGHSWCIVGYVDDEDVPGGGYFIVRNSWGTNWAVDSPEASGHGLMPYEYVERYAFEAFTGPTKVTSSSTQTATDSELIGFVRVLEEDERDVDGKLLKRGAGVLYRPSQPEAIREDNPANRQDFLRLNKAWTPQARQRIWFPPISSLPTELTTLAEDCRSSMNSFVAAVDENVMSAKRQPIPEVKSLPFWFSVLAWEPKIKSVAEVADLTTEFVRHLILNGGVPQQVAWPDDWSQFVTGMNSLKVYALRGMTTTVYVVAAAPACIHFQAPGQPKVSQPSQETIDLVCAAYQHWTRESGQRAAFTFFTLASALPWPDHVTGHAAGDHWLVVSSRTTDGNWNTNAPPRFADRLSLRNFLDGLRPETRNHRI